MSERHDLWTLADELQMDLRAAQAKLVAFRAHLAALNLPDPTRVTCDACSLTFTSTAALAEHVYLQHDGPEPAHWLAAEALAVSETDPDEDARLAFSKGRSAYDPDNDDPGRLEHRGKAADVNGPTAPGSGDEA